MDLKISDIIAQVPPFEELKPHLKIILPAGVAIFYVSFVLLRWLYRISPFHHLYRFPRPSMWAAATEWYDFYWNVIHDGQMVFKMQEWHKKYGPVVRIGPNELSVADPDFHPVCFQVGYKFVVYNDFYKATNFGDEANIGIRDMAEYRRRRQALNPLFSKAAIGKLEGRLRSYVDEAVQWVDTHINDPEGIHLGKLFRCMNLDIITEYIYAETSGTLASGNLNNLLLVGLKDTLGYFWMFNFFYPVQRFMDSLPLSLVKKMVPPEFTGVLDMQQKCEVDAKEYLKDPHAMMAKHSHKTVFEALVIDGPKNVKGWKPLRLSALTKETIGIVGAGTETTAAALTISVYQAIVNPHIQKTLYKELVTAFPDGENITFAVCEHLPYLSAFIKEALRISPGIPGRLPRVVPKGGTVVDGKYLKPGVVVSMSAYIMHNDPNVFSEPHKFKPERWLNVEKGSAMEKNWVPFSSGSRSCLGVNLAMAELYITLAVMLRNFEFSLHPDNTQEDKFIDHIVTDWCGNLVVTAKRR